MNTELLDLDFGPEPPLRAPSAALTTGRQALRRRRLVTGTATALCATALGGFVWTAIAVRPLTDNPPIATTRIVDDLPVVRPDDCLRPLDVCVELVSQNLKPSARPGGDMAIGFRNGHLVRYSRDVDVVEAIIDPTATGATGSAAVDVRFHGAHFRVALAEGFGYLIDELDTGEAPTLAHWFAQQRALPTPNCAISSPGADVPPADTPNPGECWVEVNEHGRVVARNGGHISRTFHPDLAPGTLPPGVGVTGVAFDRSGQRWFGVVRTIGADSFVSTTHARTEDLHGVTLEAWVRSTAPEWSPTGIPDAAQPQLWQTLAWWNPRTGRFQTPDGAAILRKVNNPLHLPVPQDSAGIVFTFQGRRYWAITQVNPPQATSARDDVREGGITVTRAQGASESGDFDAWLAAVAADFDNAARKHG